ncbi:MAG: substrate-binding periplasmic protein [Planctomycetota bacterium]|jgi:polar amino acid transport system substrate-binding protein
MSTRPALLVLALALLLPACSTTPPIVVASDLDNAPFAWVDDEGRPAGRDVEMMTVVARMLDRPIEWRRMEFDQLLPAAERGEVDLVCATVGITNDRAKRVDFSRPYFTTDLAVIVRTGEGEPTRLADLKDLRVGAAAGTTSEFAVRRALPAAVGVYDSKDGLTSLERLLLGEVDALVMDGPAADALVEGSAGTITRLAESLGAERYALAMPKGRDTLRTQIDDCLRTLSLGGSFDRWNARFGLVEASTVVARD